MAENSGESRKKQLDDFWDIDMITPKMKSFSRQRKNTPETVEITVSSVLEDIADKDGVFRDEPLSSQGVPVIHKNLFDDAKAAEKNDLLELEYSPENSLIHKVRIFGWKAPYNYYDDFYREAKRLLSEEGRPCDSVPFFSYVPQYDQLSPEQRAYYLYFRTLARREEFIDVDYSYILLYVYEILNLGGAMEARFAQRQLCLLWLAYRQKYPRLKRQLLEWICDYSLIAQLSPPVEIDAKLIADEPILKEFFVVQRGGDLSDYTDALLSLASSYDYRTSKFAAGERLPYYEKYIPAALQEAIKHLSRNGVLSEVGFNDCTLARDAYAGALCSHKIKKRIEIEYCSFSKTNELRYLVGDIVKYSENKLRAHMGIKSRLSCYSVPSEIQLLLDEYFQRVLPKHYSSLKKPKRQEYDKLYDLPAKEFSLADAEKIEEESWKTTKNLVEAFEEEGAETPSSPQNFIAPIEPIVEETGKDGLFIPSLEKYMDFVIAVYKKDIATQRECARALGKLPDTVVDEINEISAELIGDIFIEDGERGYEIIEDYTYYLEDINGTGN